MMYREEMIQGKSEDGRKFTFEKDHSFKVSDIVIISNHKIIGNYIIKEIKNSREINAIPYKMECRIIGNVQVFVPIRLRRFGDKEIQKGMSNKIFIGIDPDVEKSGIAFTQNGIIELSNYTFFELFDYLKYVKEKQTDEEILVVIEGGWLNKSNWHTKKKGSAALNAKIGSHTGANHETGKKIVEMVKYLELPYRVVRPTKTKLKAEVFNKITGVIGRTNQEQRDACMLVFKLK